MAEPAALSGEPRAQTLFWTPVIAEMWLGAPQHNAALRNTILNHVKVHGGVAKSNVHGWQSDVDLERWGGPAAISLRDHALSRAQAFTEDHQADARPIGWSVEMWANVSRRGASNQTHAHPGSFWSAVYYVEDGFGGSADKSLAGELSFLDPRFPAVRMIAPDLRPRHTDGTLDNQEVWLRPRSGLFVMFPSWLLHSVRPYGGQGTRISIAINVMAEER